MEWFRLAHGNSATFCIQWAEVCGRLMPQPWLPDSPWSPVGWDLGVCLCPVLLDNGIHVHFPVNAVPWNQEVFWNHRALLPTGVFVNENRMRIVRGSSHPYPHCSPSHIHTSFQALLPSPEDKCVLWVGIIASAVPGDHVQTSISHPTQPITCCVDLKKPTCIELVFCV